MSLIEHETLLPHNGDLRLAVDDAILSLGDREVESEVSIVLQCARSPELAFSGVFEHGEHPLAMLGLAFQERADTIRLLSSGDVADVHASQIGAGSPASFVARLMSGLVVVGDRAPVQIVKFSLINFPDFLSQEASGTYRNSVTLADQTHEICIRPVDNGTDQFDALKARGGFASTHDVAIRRRDDAEMSFGDASEILECIHQFLSFARGAWVGITPPLGLGTEGAPVWREIGLRLVDSWSPRIAWADRHNFQELPPAFAGFAKLWANDQQQSLLRKTIYWYLRSNNSSSGIDGGIILTQAALESLAWSNLVERGARLSRGGFEKLTASDRLRLLLSALDIPLAIPSSLQELATIGGKDWDGPRAFTEIRNDLVHPIRKAGRFVTHRLPYFEAWNLGQWYIEMVVLRLSHFSGVHSQRTNANRWVGEVHRVPWSA